MTTRVIGALVAVLGLLVVLGGILLGSIGVSTGGFVQHRWAEQRHPRGERWPTGRDRVAQSRFSRPSPSSRIRSVAARSRSSRAFSSAFLSFS